MLFTGKGVSKDTGKAASFFKQACDNDGAAGCSNLGYQYVSGLGVTRDRGRGLDLLRRGCSAGYEWGCEQLKAAGGSR
jgi:TPR repeat protein